MVSVGTHVAAFEPPDIFIIRQVGDFTAEEVTKICDAVDALVAGKSTLFAIIEQSDAGKLVAEGRKVLLARMPAATIGVAFINVSTFARIGISLGKKAFSMMSLGRDVPHTFVESAAAAHAWIAEQRKLQGGGPDRR